MDLKSVGIYANPQKDTKLKGACMVSELLRERGIFVSFDEEGMPPGEKEIIDYKSIDCLFVLGGDGTLLKAALKTSEAGVCMLGFNLGRLGFLTEAELSDADSAIDALLKGRYFIEKRMMLGCAVRESDRDIHFAKALNEIAVLKKDMSRMISVELFIDGTLADKVACDGMLVSTPTGSTGYSLSAGGPILSPQLRCMLATPICAHSLHSRALVVAEEHEIIVRPTAPDGMVLTTDGVQRTGIISGQEIIIKKSAQVARFVRFREDYFYPLLRSKFLNWDR